MKRICAIAMFLLTVPFTASSVDTKSYTLKDGDFLCYRYTDMKLLIELIQQSDTPAMNSLFTNGNCIVIRNPMEVYQMNIIGILAQVRLKGSTAVGWTLRNDLKSKASKTKIKKSG